MPTAWLQLSLKAPPSALDAISNFLIERGSPGLVLKDNEVRAFFPSPGMASTLRRDIRRFLKAIGGVYPGIAGQSLRWTVLKDRDWSDSWRRFFPPQKVGRGLLIVPPWLSPTRPPRRKVIIIEPGMAFGTGSHPTTRCSLEFLEEAVTLLGSREVTALDVGTGSGILAIALAKMGVRRVVALDNDPVALEVARKNLFRNGVGRTVKLCGSSLRRASGSYDIIVANLTAEAIIALASELRNRLSPGGCLILSGILESKREDVQNAFIPDPFVLIRRKVSRGWATFLLKKKGS